MNDYVVTGIVGISTSLALYTIVRMRYGRGLLSRIFGVMMPFVAVLGCLGVILGKQGINVVTVSITVMIAGVFILVMAMSIQRTIVDRITAQSGSLLKIASRLAATAQEAAASSEEQAAAVAQVTSSVDEIHRMSQTTTEKSQSVVKVADQAVSQGHEGLDSVREVVGVMERFSHATDFVQVVGEVAEQSNLLAVNAGIEASKAGDFGRGFSVVASEVRNLAEQSRDAAKQIREAIAQTKVGQLGLSKTDDVISSLGLVLQETSDKARQISGAAMQQAAGIKQISDAMNNLTQGGRDTAAASKQIQHAVDELYSVGRELADIVSERNSAQTQLSEAR